MRKGTSALIILMACQSITGCSGGNRSLPSINLSLTAINYTLGAGDKLRITVYGEDNLTGEYLVDGSGTVSFPLIGTIKAQGITASDLSQNISNALSQGYLDSPNVTIDTLNLRPYYILGEVNKPGEYAFAEGLTIFSAVAKAEGFTYRADNKRVYIRHKSGLDEALYQLNGTTPVQPGDTIRILERKF